MERINLVVVVAALVVLVMSAVKPEAPLGDYQLVLSPTSGRAYVINTDSSEVWLRHGEAEWKSCGKADK